MESSKQMLRKKYKAMRQTLNETTIEEHSIAIANQLLQLPVWNHTYYHLFLSIVEHKEIDTELILHLLSGKDKEIIVSRTDFASREMTHFLLTDNTRIKKNEYNIPEPVDGIEVPAKKIDVVFVPLLAYDKKGNRVGYGKGFYDTFLANCKPDVIKIGLSFFEPENVIDDVFEGDIPLDYCVTPTQIYTF